MKRLWVVGCAALLFGCSEPPAKTARPVRTITVQHARGGESITLTGQIQAQDQARLSFRIAGRLIERTVSVGDRVEPGQIVARLEPQDSENVLKSAEADLSSARATLVTAQNQHGRLTELLSKGFTTRALYDQAEQQLRTAESQVASAEAKLRNARDNVGYTELKSDFAGSVTAKGAEPGEIVAPGRMIVQIAGQGGRDAVFNVPPQIIRNAPQNPEIVVTLADDPSISTAAKVREVAPQADAATGTYAVKVSLVNPPQAMRLGATVVGRMVMGSDIVIQVPGVALTQTNGKSAVWVVDPGTKKVALREVLVARYDPSSVVISDGLNDGDIVVTAGVQTLRPGQEVRLLDQTADQRK